MYFLPDVFFQKIFIFEILIEDYSKYNTKLIHLNSCLKHNVVTYCVTHYDV